MVLYRVRDMPQQRLTDCERLNYHVRMDNLTPAAVPTTAYDLLTAQEREAVDEYVSYAIRQQHAKGERIIHALYIPIPSEYIRRSRNALYKPLVLAAVAEQIRKAANDQDISPDRVIAEHVAIATANLHDYYHPGEFGTLTPKAIHELTLEQKKAVKSIEIKPGPFGISHKIVLHEKQTSLKALGEMMGLVAPDKPPALVNYVKPPEAERQVLERAPERAYAELLADA